MSAALPRIATNPRESFNRKIPLRLLLIVPFVLQIFLSVGLVGYLSFRNGQKAVNDLANQLIDRVNSLVDQHLDSYMNTPPKLAQINADALDLGLLDPHDMQAIGHFFWKQMQLYKVGYLSYGSREGEYAGSGFFIDPNHANVDEVSPRKHDNLNMYIYKTDSQGNRTKLATVIENFETRKEAWYVGAQKAGKLTWNPIYQWGDGSGTIAIAVSRPVYDQNNQLLGVISVDQPLVQISDFLRGLKVSPAGRILILERNGLLVASSGTEPPFKVVDKIPQRIKAIDSQDPLIQATAQHLIDRFGDFAQISNSYQFEFRHNNQREFVQVTPWRDQWGLDWLVVVTVPESDFMTQIHRNNRTTLLLCLGALLLAILVGFYTSRWISRPILQLSAASQAIASGELDHSVNASQVHELDILARSFNQMAQQLRDSFAALENTNTELETRVVQRTEELSHALRDLQQTQAQLVQTEKMSSLGQMLAGLAHEINNPTNFIHGNLEYTAEYIQDLLKTLQLYQKYYPQPAEEIQQHSKAIDLAFLTADLPALLDSMQQGTQRIQEIILTLRNFSRLDEAKIKPVDIHEGLDSTLLILEHRLKGKSVRPDIKIIKHYSQLPLMQCYAGEINQVFMNIMANAIDAIEETWSCVSREQSSTLSGISKDTLDKPINQQFDPVITITTELANSEFIRVHIADNGTGMTEAVKAKLFDPFFTTKPVGKGTGLGLSISYQIVVEHHKGNLSFISDPGTGTEFTIELPIRYGGSEPHDL